MERVQAGRVDLTDPPGLAVLASSTTSESSLMNAACICIAAACLTPVGVLLAALAREVNAY